MCLKDPGFDVDAVIRADLAAFTRLSLGYIGVREAVAQGEISFHGSKPAIALLCRLMQLPESPTLKQFRYAAFPIEGRTRDLELAASA